MATENNDALTEYRKKKAAQTTGSPSTTSSPLAQYRATKPISTNVSVMKSGQDGKGYNAGQTAGAGAKSAAYSFDRSLMGGVQFVNNLTKQANNLFRLLPNSTTGKFFK